jgi:SAM-dependent methyltransferase
MEQREIYIERYREWAQLLGVREVGLEASKSYLSKLKSGFFRRYLSGSAILDIGYKGYVGNAAPIVAQAIGVDLDYPGYDGVVLPFDDESQDAVYSSHCLEHLDDPRIALREWHRVTKIGGFVVIAVPHQHLYEKKNALPSRWAEDHKHFYTPASLMAEVEATLAPNSYRVRHLGDNDFLHDYSLGPELHSNWCYEIELVLQRIALPDWTLA